jgi:anthranilate phosphoribosyltransferase
MNIQEAIRAVTEARNLSDDEMTQVMRQIMTGDATPAQIGGFLIGLRMKGETADEVAAAARVMRELAAHVTVDDTHLVDIVGTGGDSSGSFNVSTASALVAAAAGARVAKHGNRSVSSQSGSADLLEAAGVNLQLSPAQVAACIDTVGMGFMFAPAHHSAMKYAIGPRREMAVRTIFNVLGPLTNPASAPNQLLGVFSRDWVEPIAQALQRLGSRHVMVVHSDDDMDEISISAATFVAELRQGEIRTYQIRPEDFGVQPAAHDSIKVHGPEESLQAIRGVLDNQATPARDIVALNAGAAIYVAGVADSHAQGVEKAFFAIASGAARDKLQELQQFTQAQSAAGA